MSNFINNCFRIYPSKHQIERLRKWNDALRFLWNLALEQRLDAMNRPRGYKKYWSAYDQGVQLTELRKELPWLMDVPRHVCVQILDDLENAWKKCFGGLTRPPRFKNKGFQFRFKEFDLNVWKRSQNVLHFPKLGKITIKSSRICSGKAKSCSLVRDVDQWFAVVTYEVTATTPEPRTDPVLAIDRGIVKFGATSDGKFIENPRLLEKSLKKLARAQRAVARKQAGSANSCKAKLKVAKIHRKIRRQREHFLHVETAKLAKAAGTVVLEKLQIENMVKNRKLAQSIASAGWGKFAQYLKYKLRAAGGRVVEVPAQYSSQTCSACGHVTKENRQSQSLFACVKCQYRDNADVNAAKVLLSRYYTPGNPWCQPAEGSASKGTQRSRKRTGLKAPDEGLGLVRGPD